MAEKLFVNSRLKIEIKSSPYRPKNLVYVNDLFYDFIIAEHESPNYLHPARCDKLILPPCTLHCQLSIIINVLIHYLNLTKFDDGLMRQMMSLSLRSCGRCLRLSQLPLYIKAGSHIIVALAML